MRRMTSIILALAFIAVSITGLQLTAGHGPRTEVSQSRSQQIVSAGVQPERTFYPKGAHEVAGFVFIGAGLVHLAINRKSMLTHVKVKR